MIIRAKTKDLFQSDDLTESQLQNSRLNKYEIENGITVLKSYPQRIVLELTSSCNLRCVMCGRNFADFKPSFFDIKWLDKISPLLSCVEEVTLIGWGEPTMHPKFGEILRFLNQYPVRKFVCTNGMLLDKHMDAIFDEKVDLLTVSLDGSTAETNELIRKGSDFQKIIESVKELVKRKKDNSLSYPYLSTTTTIMKSNLKELPKIVRLAGELGFNEAKAVYLTAFSKELADEVLYNRTGEVKRAFEAAEEAANKYGLKLKLPYIQGNDEAGEKNHKDCYAAWRDFFLSSDGYARPCMSTPIKLLNFDDYDNFFDLWNAPEMTSFRSSVNNPDMPESCKRCYQASYANWNRKEAFLQLEGDFSPDWEK